MNLIKEMNEQLKVKDPVELAFESVANPESDMVRIADHWRDVMAKKPNLSEEELQAGVGNDLEMLEYSPEEVDQMMTQVLNMVIEA